MQHNKFLKFLFAQTFGEYNFVSVHMNITYIARSKISTHAKLYVYIFFLNKYIFNEDKYFRMENFNYELNSDRVDIN